MPFAAVQVSLASYGYRSQNSIAHSRQSASRQPILDCSPSAGHQKECWVPSNPRLVKSADCFEQISNQGF